MQGRFFLTAFFLFFSTFAYSAEPLPPSLKAVGVSENIGGYVSLELPFFSSDGSEVHLSDFFGDNKAVVLNLAYYSCPMLCHLVSNGVATAIEEGPLKLGEKYRVLTVSIDPSDTNQTTEGFRQKYQTKVTNKRSEDDWQFLRGADPSIDALTKAVGFNYSFNPSTGDFAHSAAIIILTPDGQISRYLYGIEFKPFDFKLAILEAMDRKLISTVDRVLLFCYNYDPQSREYVLFAQNLMRIGGVITIVVLVLLILRLRKTK